MAWADRHSVAAQEVKTQTMVTAIKNPGNNSCASRDTRISVIEVIR